jgi:hypothetical protein
MEKLCVRSIVVGVVAFLIVFSLNGLLPQHPRSLRLVNIDSLSQSNVSLAVGSVLTARGLGKEVHDGRESVGGEGPSQLDILESDGLTSEGSGGRSLTDITVTKPTPAPIRVTLTPTFAADTTSPPAVVTTPQPTFAFATTAVPVAVVPTSKRAVSTRQPVFDQSQQPVSSSVPSVSLSFVNGGDNSIFGNGWNSQALAGNGLQYVDDQGWLHVRYPGGSFGYPGRGGLQFDSRPIPGGFDTMTVSYSLMVPAGFVWNMGGKLPGLFGGNSRFFVHRLQAALLRTHERRLLFRSRRRRSPRYGRDRHVTASNVETRRANRSVWLYSCCCRRSYLL